LLIDIPGTDAWLGVPVDLVAGPTATLPKADPSALLGLGRNAYVFVSTGTVEPLLLVRLPGDAAGWLVITPRDVIGDTAPHCGG
jgi:hypothetical protein